MTQHSHLRLCSPDNELVFAWATLLLGQRVQVRRGSVAAPGCCREPCGQ